MLWVEIAVPWTAVATGRLHAHISFSAGIRYVADVVGFAVVVKGQKDPLALFQWGFRATTIKCM